MRRLKEENRRYNSLISRNRIWGENKVYTLSCHNTETIRPFIILNPDVFKAFKKNQIIVISFKSKTEIKLIFKITSENYVEQARKNISIHKNIADLIIKKYNFNPKNEEVYVHKSNKQNLALTEIQIELKEYIPRSEILSLTLNMLNDCVIKGQEIYNKDKKIVGVVSKLSNDSLTGLIDISTNFKLTSLMSDIYLIFDISKSSYNYNSYFYLNYEVIIDYVKNLLLKLKSQTTYHNIHIFFYIRIFFKGNSDCEYEKKYKFVRKVPNENGKYYFDIYDKIEMFNAEHIEFNEVIYKMNKIYQNYENIQNEKFQKIHFKDLNEFLFSIRKNLQCSLEPKEKELLFQNMDNLSYTFEGFEHSGKKDKECTCLDNNIFEEITEFEISSFNTIGIFEALIFLVSQIGNNRNIKNKKYNPLINIVLSGESFPYYSRALADKVRSSIYGEYINLIFTFLCPKNKVSIFSKQKVNEKTYNNIINNDEYYEIDNFDGDIPNWCKICYIPHSFLYKNLQKYKRQFKIALLQQNNNNLDEFYDLHKVFDEKLSLDIISLHFKEEKNINEKSDQLINNINKTETKIKKKLTLEDIIQRYTIKKNNYDNYDNSKDKRDSFSSTENLKINLEKSTVSNNNISWKHDLELNEESKDNTNEHYFDIPKINLQDIEKTENELDILEDIIINVPIPYFVEYTKDLRIIPKIIKCYVVKNDIDLILKRIDNNFNIIVDNEKDEIMETIKNMIAKPSNSFHEKFLVTNRKIMNILEFKCNQVEVLEYNIMRKILYFQYYYIVANSINGSVFAKTNIRNKAINWQEKDNNKKGTKILI